jgi:hypothetical protein
MTNELEWFTRFAVCNGCGALVLNEELHKGFHENLQDAFKDRDKQVRQMFKKAGLIRKEGS